MLGIVVMVQKYHFFCKYAFIMKEKLQTKFATRQYMISDTFELYYYSTVDVPVTKVYLLFGFHDYSSFYRAFKKEYGISPKDFKELHTVTSD